MNVKLNIQVSQSRRQLPQHTAARIKADRIEEIIGIFLALFQNEDLFFQVFKNPR
jgi:hypothetical protein